jgi:hypothetical protein
MNNESESSGWQSYKISTSSTLRSRLDKLVATAGPTLRVLLSTLTLRGAYFPDTIHQWNIGSR